MAGIHNIIYSKKSNRINSPSSLLIKGNTITDSQDISEYFSNFFTSIGQDLQKNVAPTKKNFSDYLKTPTTDIFYISPTTPKEISDLIKTLKNSKSLGPNNSMPTNILKEIHETISIPLSTLVNKSFITGVFLNMGKIANVVPIFKSETRLLCNNYRPISLLTDIGKIIEKLIHLRISLFLEIRNCYYPFQFGFKLNFSTNNALMSIVENIQTQLDDGKYSAGVFVDLKKAFDTADHNILLKKLDYYGVRGIANEWFASYLKNRKQFVSIGDHISSTQIIHTGVPQGSVLGPLLLLLYVNDLNKSIKNSRVYDSADDTNILLSNESLELIAKKKSFAMVES